MIKVFSTYTKDAICNINNGEKITRNGGPAFYIENVFKRNKIKHKIEAGNAKIKIEVKDKIGKGVLAGSLKEKKIKGVKDDDIIVISTVDSEWILSGNLPDNAKIFLDVQGYIRSARKNPAIFEADFWNVIYCMKTNDKEIKELPAKIISDQKSRLLIITKGEKGAEIYFKGKKYNFKVEKIKAVDYIGAGDTFFAGFIIAFVESKSDIIKSGNFAAKEVTEFLLNKK